MEFYLMINVIVAKYLKGIYFIVYGNVRCPGILHQGCILHHHISQIMSPSTQPWAIFGYIDPEEIPCTVSSRKLLYMISAAGLKTFLHTWNHVSQPPFEVFLEKLTFLIKKNTGLKLP